MSSDSMATTPVCFVPTPMYSRLHRSRLPCLIDFLACYALPFTGRRIPSPPPWFSTTAPLAVAPGAPESLNRAVAACLSRDRGLDRFRAAPPRPASPPAALPKFSTGTVRSECIGRDLLLTTDVACVGPNCGLGWYSYFTTCPGEMQQR